jgi:hypothetical protein
MALEQLTNISSALAELFDPIVQRQMNRKAVLLSRLPKQPGRGKTCAWDVEFSGAAADTYTEGADVGASDMATDIKDPATLAWGFYRSSFGVSGLAKAVAMSSNTSPEELQALIGDDLVGSASKLASVINTKLYVGSGTGHVIGLDSAIAATGTYAGVNKATRTEWAGNVLSNSGTKRALTKALLDELEQKIYDASGEMPDLYITTSKIARKYEALFDQVQRTVIVNDLSSAGPAGRGPDWDVANGETGFNYKGHPLLRDKDCKAEHFFMLNSNYVQVQAVPQVLADDTGVRAEIIPLRDEKGNLVGLPVHYQKLAKTGDSDRFSLVVYVQLRVKRVNANGFINDIDEA